MSRRKQSNPKPLLKSECQETSEEMTVERDNKDFSNNELNEEAASTEIDLAEQFSSESLQENSSSPRSSELDLSIKQSPKGNSAENQEPAPPKVRLNVTLASDPALKPNAKDIKIIKDDLQEEITQKTESDEDPLFNLGQIKSPSNPDVSHRIKVFMCHPCGIGFSSLSTLEAHQTYYCSHRKDTEEEGNQNSSSICEKNSSGEPASKSIKTGKQYACSQCSYSADKKVSLNRHMRMHQTSPTLSSNASNGDECSSQQIDRYCSECDIRFSNIKTYRAHKQHYCSSRRTEGQITPKSESKKSGSVSPQERSKTPVTVNPPQPFLALPTNPILIIPYSLVRTASVLPGPLTSLTMGTSNPDTTCFTFENGTLQPLATAITTQVLAESTTRMQSQISNQTTLLTEKNTRIVNEGLKTNRKEGSSRETVPLDLTVRKSPISKQFPRTDRLPSFTSEEIKLDIETMMEGKENLSIDSGRMTPEQIVCAPSLPNSPSLTPSPKRHVISPRTNVLAISPGPNSVDQSTLRSLLPSDTSLKLAESKSIVTPLLSKQSREIALKMTPASKSCEATNALPSPLLGLPGNPISVVPTIPAVQPQMYVKQGVSKCIECNIVFCKFENFLAHKQHYCSARNQEGSESKITTPPATVNHTETASPPVAYQQLICAACGIKYTSLDNLRAHQTFYCPKGGDFTTQMLGKEKCPKCKIIHEIGQQCPISQGSYKCPVCDVISPSASENRKHLETHGCVKAFRCSICRYKGNTLRGMRTHIRMHFDKKTSDFNEENYMSCILEEDGIEIASTAPISQEQHLQQQLYNCDICNYSSSYKGNVIRHMKLVHSQQSSSPPSVSPEVGEGIENLTQNGDSKLTKPVESITVKKELSEIMQNKDGSEDVTTYIKSEPEDKREIDTNMSALPCTSPLSAEENSLKIISQKYCQVCDIKFTYMNTYIAHKQFYCKNKRSENEVTNSVQSAVGSSKNKENMETVL